LVKEMLQAINFDWGGTQEELKKFIESFKKGCKDCGGIEYKGLYTPNNHKWHYSMFIETDDYNNWAEVFKIAREKYGVEMRDYQKMPHAVIEVYNEYLL
jgi:hypothetical protein